ncbi:MAG: DUF4139 domain-containing protein [Acidobacteria bacterium]|nr:DUF4139 domain-containing protein [Acidobacteriota bacterium]
MFGTLFFLFAVLNCADQSENEMLVSSRIVEAGLFKNGLVIVTEEIPLNGPGTYRLESLPEAIHGSLWVEAGDKIVARTSSRSHSKPLTSTDLDDLTDVLNGEMVSLVFFGEEPELTGRLVGPSMGPMLVLETQNGHLFVEKDRIETIRAHEKVTLERNVDKQVLLFQIGDTDASTIRFHYLTRGMSWAPSYHINLKPDGHMTLTQNAVIRNEWRDLNQTELWLISGFPNYEFAHVTSPLTSDWHSFFNAMNRPTNSGQIDLTANVMQQVRISSRYDAWSEPTPGGEGLDSFRQRIGAFDLDSGEAIMIQTLQKAAPYQRIVCWEVANRRAPDGRNLSTSHNEDPLTVLELWDTLQFNNPFEVPMTTAPAAVYHQGNLAGQSLSTWANPGAATRIKVTRALSVEANDHEWVEDGEQKEVKRYGNRYLQQHVKGSLAIRNTRTSVLDMEIVKRVTGRLVRADGDPRVDLLEEGAYQVNLRTELNWRLSLEPGEKVEFDYEYEVLVRI